MNFMQISSAVMFGLTPIILLGVLYKKYRHKVAFTKAMLEIEVVEGAYRLWLVENPSASFLERSKKIEDLRKTWREAMGAK